MERCVTEEIDDLVNELHEYAISDLKIICNVGELIHTAGQTFVYECLTMYMSALRDALR